MMKTYIALLLCIGIAGSLHASDVYGEPAQTPSERVYNARASKGQNRLPIQDFHDEALGLILPGNRVRDSIAAERLLLNVIWLGAEEKEQFRVLNTVRAGGVLIEYSHGHTFHSPFRHRDAQRIHEKYQPHHVRLGTVNLRQLVSTLAQRAYAKLFPAHERLFRMPTLIHGIGGSVSGGIAFAGKQFLTSLDDEIAVLQERRSLLHKKLPPLYRLYKRSSLVELRKKPLDRRLRFVVDALLSADDRLKKLRAQRRRALLAMLGGSVGLFLTIISHVSHNPAAAWADELVAYKERAAAKAVQTQHGTAAQSSHLKAE